MDIFVDGDGCPVKKIVYQEAQKYQIKVSLVTSIAHFSIEELPENVSVIYVDQGHDAADFRILSTACAGDLVITQDYGLGALALAKGIRVLHQSGFEYTSENIDGLLQQRHFSAMERKAGGRTKGPTAFSEEQRSNFRKALIQILQENESEDEA